MNEPADDRERLRRWRLVLGGDDDQSLAGNDARLDAVLTALYGPEGGAGEQEGKRSAGLGGSAPRVARWLGDIREFFPTPVVQVMQKDALARLNLQQLLLEPEMLEAVEADVHLVATLVSLNRVIPERSRDSARQVVRKLVDALMERLRGPMEQAVRGSLDRARRTRRPRHADIDWLRTIRANLRHYQPEYQSVVPETLIGYARRRRQALQEVVLCVDQSGSMASSVVYASIFSAVLASLPSLATRLVVFDTAVVDLTELLDDPVEVLFATQLGGGTDINRAVTYCQQGITRPESTTFVLITDLCEGGNGKELLKRAGSLLASGVNLVTLLALNDDGAAYYDQRMAARFAALGSPTFACTPDQFPDLMAAALQREDLNQWAAAREIVTARAGE